VVIPCYNHATGIGTLLDELGSHGLPTVIVDDGSTSPQGAILDSAARQRPWTHVIRLGVNRGKGVAVVTGLRWAAERGFTHAIQIDADRQHQVADIPRFLDASRRSPDALVLGKPIFGDDVPIERLLGRQLSRVSVYAATLSFRIGDPLIGFRIYPLAATLSTLEESRIPARMDFDAELAVRLCWRGLPIINIPTAIRYPPDGTSNYRLFRDNVRLTWMHIRLFFGMIPRAPRILLRREG